MFLVKCVGIELMDLKRSLVLGMSFAGGAIGVVKTLGFSSTSFMALAYGYPLLAAIQSLWGSDIGLNNIYLEKDDGKVKKIGKEKVYRLESQ